MSDREWVCLHPGVWSEVFQGYLAVHECSPKEDPDSDPMHVKYHKQFGCGWQEVEQPS